MKVNQQGLFGRLGGLEQSVSSAIMAAARDKFTLTIRYIDSKGTITEREVEPYALKNGKFWGFDLAKNETRQFNRERILSATVTKRTFAPRWPIEI